MLLAKLCIYIYLHAGLSFYTYIPMSNSLADMEGMENGLEVLTEKDMEAVRNVVRIFKKNEVKNYIFRTIFQSAFTRKSQCLAHFVIFKIKI